MASKKSEPDAMKFKPVSIGNALNHTGKGQNTPIKNEFVFNALNKPMGGKGSKGKGEKHGFAIDNVGLGKTNFSIPTVKELSDRTTKQVKALKAVKDKS